MHSNPLRRKTGAPCRYRIRIIARIIRAEFAERSLYGRLFVAQLSELEDPSSLHNIGETIRSESWILVYTIKTRFEMQ